MKYAKNPLFGAKQCLSSETAFEDLVTSDNCRKSGSTIDSFLSSLDNCLKEESCIFPHMGAIKVILKH